MTIKILLYLFLQESICLLAAQNITEKWYETEDTRASIEINIEDANAAHRSLRIKLLLPI